MIFTKKTIWESCTKEEYDQVTPKSSKYRRVPIYNNMPTGLLNQIKLVDKEPNEWRYEKAIGKKLVIILSEKEANDKRIVDLLNQEI